MEETSLIIVAFGVVVWAAFECAGFSIAQGKVKNQSGADGVFITLRFGVVWFGWRMELELFNIGPILAQQQRRKERERLSESFFIHF